MKQRFLWIAAMTLIVSGMQQSLSAQPPSLTDQTLADFRTAIEPNAEESAFLAVDWYSELRRAVQQAHRTERPLLIYVMNGHPLGCT